MKFTSKSKFKTIFILFLALAVTLSVALWGIFRTRNSTTAVADTGVGAITSAMNDADADWQTQREIYIWSTADPSDQGSDQIDNLVNSSTSAADIPTDSNTVNLLNGIVFKITSTYISAEKKEIRIKSGAQVTVNAVDPSVKRELENNATYTQIIFDVPVVVEAEAVLTLNADVVFRAGVTVYGTLIINGMAFNQAIPGADGNYTEGEVTIDDEGAATVTSGMMYIANEVNSYAQIQSRGVIVNGSLNNDAARGGAIEIASGATLTIEDGSGTEYADGTIAADGGALFLKGDGTDYNLTGEGKIENYGSIIYESGIALPSGMTINNNSIDLDGDNAPDAFGVSVGATFVSAFPTGGFSSDTVYVFYPAVGATSVNTYGTALSITNGSTRSWSSFSLLSFGRTTITNSADNVSYTLSNMNLGGGTSEGKTYTQGANELIFDGGAKWEETTSQDNNRDTIYNLGASSGNQGDHSVTDLRFFNGGDNEQNYTNNVISSNEALVVVGIEEGDSSNNTLSVYGGVRIMHHETRAGNGVGGAIRVSVYVPEQNQPASQYTAELIMYGGEISYNAVTQSSNQGTGAGIYIDNASATIYGGKISYNAVATYIAARIERQSGSPRDYVKSYTAVGSADGAGIAVDSSAGNPTYGSTLNLYGGEISHNHGATGSTQDPGADGGGLIARYSVVNMYGGSISGNYAGGSGGGMLLWDSELTMTGGEISNNRAAFGGGIGMTSDNTQKSTITVSGGEISGNEAIVNNYISTTSGYGGGICVGSEQYSLYSSATFSGNALVTGNTAVYGGGLAVYTSNDPSANSLSMSGGTVSGNKADTKANGDGVYVYCNSAIYSQGEGMLRLSGSASIDTSNNVSFAFNGTPANITVYVFSGLYTCPDWNGTSSQHKRIDSAYYDGNLYVRYDSDIYNKIVNGNLTQTEFNELKNYSGSQPVTNETHKHLGTVIASWNNDDTASIGSPYSTKSLDGLYNMSAPITVSEEGLSGNALAALVYLGDDTTTGLWEWKNIISFADENDVNRDKFILDSTQYAFAASGQALQISAEANIVAVVDGVGDSTLVGYSTLSEAVAAAGEDDTVYVVGSATLTEPIVIDKNITILPRAAGTMEGVSFEDQPINFTASGAYTLAVASEFDTSSYPVNPALFYVTNGATLTLGGTNAGTLAVSSNESINYITLVSVVSGSYVQNAGITLYNNKTESNGGAIYLGAPASGASVSATINGGAIENNEGGGGAIYVSNGAQLTVNGGTISGNTDSRTIIDSQPAQYGIFLTGSASLTLDSSVELTDAINAQTTGTGITYDVSSGTVGSQKIRLTYPENSDAGAIIVAINGSLATDGESRFALYGMDEDEYRLTPNADRSALIVVKSIEYIFYFDYSNGFAGDSERYDDVEYSYGSVTADSLTEAILQALEKDLTSPFNEDRLNVREAENALLVQIFSSGETFDLSKLRSIAQKEGFSLVRWQNASGGEYNATTTDLVPSSFSADIVLRSVWAPNEYNITYLNNNGSIGTGVTVQGEMEVQSIKYTSIVTEDDPSEGGASGDSAEDAVTLTQNAYTIVGWRFLGWSTGSDIAVGDFLPGTGDGKNGFGDKQEIDAATLNRLIQGVTGSERIENNILQSVQYDITLYAVWAPIFSGGVGTSTDPFVIAEVSDLYMLEATVMHAYSATDASVTVPTSAWSDDGLFTGGYFNESTQTNGKWTATYTAEDYEGYYFELAEGFDNSGSAFTGVIGRVSTAAVTDGTPASEGKAHLNQEDQISQAVYGSDAAAGGTGVAAGTPFKGTFDGNGKTITLNINKQKVEGNGADGATVSAGETVDAANGYEAYTQGDETLVGVGLFGYTDHATITNLTLAGSVHGYSHVGGLVGYAFGGTISNVTNTANITSGGHDVGGVIGTFFETAANYSASSVTNVLNQGNVTYAPRENGNKTTVLDVEDNWNELSIIADAEGIRFGGIVGAGVTLRLTGGYNRGSVTARYGVGGVVGTLRSLDDNRLDDAQITDSFNTGSVTATAGLYAVSVIGAYSQEFITAYTGGIVGRLVGVSSVRASFNSGSVSATFVAQIVSSGTDGATTGTDGDLTITYKPAIAPEIGSSDSNTYLGARGVGGIVGFTSVNASAINGRMEISNVYNTGNISAWAGVGGIAGYLAYVDITNSFNGGNVTATGSHSEGSSRVAGGYAMTYGDETVYAAFLGAVVGRGIGVQLNSTVSFNMNSTYTGGTDAVTSAIGDSSYNSIFGFTGNDDAASGLTSTQMRVSTAGSLPEGFAQSFNTSSWVFFIYSDTYSYYPQLAAFASSEGEKTLTIGGTQIDVGAISKKSAQITYRTTGDNDQEIDVPITDDQTFTLTFNLSYSDAFFTLDDPIGADGSGMSGGTKTYTKNDDGSYSYTFTYPTDGTDIEDTPITTLEEPRVPTRVGYEFTGWYVDSGCTQLFNFNSIPGSNTIVYAGWTPVEYNITYLNVDDVGGSIGGDYRTSFTVEDIGNLSGSIDLTTDVTRRGYEFTGWQYGSEGSRQTVTRLYVAKDIATGAPTLYLYNDRSVITSIVLDSLNNNTLYLYATWENATYTITYYLDDAAYNHGSGTAISDVPEDFASYTFGTQLFTLWSGASNPGYTFNGWKIVSYEDSDSINQGFYENRGAIYALEAGTVGDIVLVGDWTPIDYTITFNLGSGSLSSELYSKFSVAYKMTSSLGLYSITIGYGITLGSLTNEAGEAKPAWDTFVPTAPEGYKFAGWYTGLSGAGEQITLADYAIRSDENVTLYAHYTQKTYKVTVSIPGSSSGVTGAGEAEYESISYLPTGNSIDGWTYTISGVVHGSGVEGILSAIAEALTIDENYQFTGWSIAFTEGTATGSASIYRVTGDLTVTATTTQEPIVVNFVGQDGNTLKTVSFTAESSLSDNDIPTGEGITVVFGYTFNGWSYNGEVYTAEELEALTFSTSATVYADYTAAKVTVNWQINGTIKTSDSYNFTYGSQIGTLPTLAELGFTGDPYTGYEIVNWYAKYDGNTFSDQVFAGTVFTQDQITKSETDGNVTYSITLYGEIDLHDYTITFTSNSGGSVTNWSGSTYRYSYEDSNNASVVVDLNDNFATSPNTGYELTGWSVTYNGVTDNNVLTPAGDREALASALANYLFTNKIAADITVTAQWGLTEHSVWFDAGSGTFEASDRADVTFYNSTEEGATKVTSGSARYAVITVEYGASATLNLQPTLTGSSFAGWNFGSTAVITADRTAKDGNAIVAYWTTETYTITYMLDGGTLDNSAPNTYQYAEEGNGVITFIDPEKEGYEFEGWYTESTYTNSITSTAGRTGNLVLYAKWSVKTYYAELTITGLPSVTSQSTVEGWFNGTGLTDLKVTASTETDGTVTATVTFSADYGTDLTALNGVLEMQPVSGEGSTTYYIPGNWMDGGTVYYFTTMPARGESESSPFELTCAYTSTTDENITFTVTFYANYSDDNQTVLSKTTGLLSNGEGTVSFFTPSREGYTFKGWATSENGSVIEGSNSAGATYTVTGNTSLYAIWEISSYSVSYQTNGGSWASGEGATTLKYGEVINANEGEISVIPEITRTGYTFGGWYTDPNFSKESRINTMPAYSVTLYAQWIPNGYQVNFYYGDTSATSNSLGSYAGSTSSAVSFEYGAAIAFNDANVDHYTFVWYMYANGSAAQFSYTTMPDLSSNTFSKFVTKSGENGTVIYTINLYAVYTAVEYSINYQGNYAPTTMTAADTSEHSLTSANVSTGYEFLGWTIGDSETAYSYYIVGEKEEVNGVYFRTGAGETTDQKFVAFTELANNVLVPSFQPIEYTFTLNANGGTLSSTGTINVTFGEYYGTLPTPTRNGYTFLGWYTAQENGILIGSTTTLTTGTLPSDVSDSAKTGTLYALWEESTYTVTYVLNGGSWVGGNPTVTEYTYGTGATLPAEDALTAPTGYTFAGWYTEETDGQKVDAIGTDEYGNKTFYARWTANSYTVTFSGDHVTNSKGTLTYDQDYTVIISAEGGYDVAGVTITYTNDPYGAVGSDAYSLVGNVLTINKNQITGDITITVETKPHTYTITLDGTNVSAAEDSTFTTTHGTQYSLTLAPNEGYSLPNSVTVTMGGEELTAGDGYTYADGKITITSVTGNIVIAAKGQVESYAVTVSPSGDEGQNFTVDGTTGDNARAYNTPYTVTFTANDGYTITNIAVSADGVGLTDNTDYTINLSNGTVTIFANRVAADVTITVTATAITYTVVFDLNGGSGANVTVKNVAYHTTLGNVSGKPTPTRDGYNFLGWATTATATGPLSDGTVISADTTYYAVWEAATYTITVSGSNLDGNTSDPAQLTHNAQYTITINAEAGYRITEYSVTMGKGGTVTPVASYSNDNGTLTLTFAAYTVTGNITINVTTAVRQYTVMFDSNGGTAVDSKTVEHGATVEAPTKPTRDGYSFVGWFTGQEGGGEFVFAGNESAMAVTANITLYAHWTENEYTVLYNVNYEGGGEIEKTSGGYTATITLGTPTTRMGYTFLGWATSDSGEVVYAGGEKVAVSSLFTGLEDENSRTLTLYAKWQINTYSITYANVEPNEVTSGGSYTVESSVTFAAAPREGYTLSWKLTNAVGTDVTSTEGCTGDLIVWAVWTAETYDVTVLPSEGADRHFTLEGDAGDNVRAYDVAYTLTIKADEGYRVTGVTVELAKGGELNSEQYTFQNGVLTFVAESVAGDVTITVKTVQVFTVSFDLNGGTGVVPAAQTADANESIALPKGEGLSRTGYDFAGWAVSADATEALEENYTVTGNITLYARWTANTYSVTFSGNGATSGDMSEQSFTYDNSKALTENAFERTGYTFLGWATEENGNVFYADKESVLNLTATANGIVTLYAVWEINTYTVTLTLTLPAAATAQIVNERMQQLSGVKLTGMSTSLSSTQEDDKTIYTITVTVTAAYGASLKELYNKISAEEFAQFSDEHDVIYTLSVEGFTENTTIPVNGASFSGTWVSEGVKTLTVTVDGENSTYYVTQTGDSYTFDLSKLDTPTKAGYKFAGWSIDREDGSINGNTLTITAKGNAVTVTATWTQIKYTVTYGGEGTGEMSDMSFYYEILNGEPNFTLTGAEGGTAELLKSLNERIGYTFGGWLYNGNVYTTLAELFAGASLGSEQGDTEIQLTAKWNAITYTIVFAANADDGLGAVNAVTASLGINGGEVELPSGGFTRVGYDFAGWAYTPDGEVIADNTLKLSDWLVTYGSHIGEDNTITLYAVWQVKTYTVTFNTKGGTLSGGTSVSAPYEGTDGASSITLENPTREGYTFLGWATSNEENATAVYSGGASISVSQLFTGLEEEGSRTLTLYAKWEAETYTVTFNGTNVAAGEGNQYTVTYQQENGYTFTLSAVTGYKLPDSVTVAIGGGEGTPYSVSKNENGTGTITIAAEDVTGNIVITAKGDAQTYTVTVSAGKGTFEEIPEKASGTGSEGAYTSFTITLTYGTNVYESILSQLTQLIVNAPTAMYLSSWEIDWTKDGISTGGNPSMYALNGDITLTAKFSNSDVTVTFVLPDGTTQQLVVAHGTTFGSLSDVPSSVTGYTINGWSLTSGGTAVTNETQFTSSTTLYAIYTANEYKVTFNGTNVTLPDGTTGANAATHGQSYTVTLTPEEGYSLPESVTVTMDGSSGRFYTYDPATGVLTISFVTGEITITAEGVINTYTVTFETNGGTAVESKTVNHGEKVTAPEQPTRDGYSFVGWYLNGAPYDFGRDVTGDITLVAQWTLNTYKVTFDPSYDGAASTTYTYAHGTTVTEPTEPTRTGYTFKFWYVQGGAETDYFSGGEKTATGTITLVAKWEINAYTVTFNPNNGEDSTTQEVDYLGKASKPADPVLEGYTFLGWYLDGAPYDFNRDVTGDITLVAQWSENYYTVTFTDGDATVASVSVKEGDMVSAPALTAEAGKTFVGWYAEGSETAFDFSTAIVANIELTAEWELAKYSVSYVLGGGTNAENNPTSYTIESGAITLTAPTREGYTFAGWYDAEENGNLVTEIAAGSTGNITLYARWTANEFTVTFEANGGTLAEGEGSQSVVYGGTATAPAALTREGYVFVGWFAESSETAFDFSTAITADIELTAKWELAKYSVSYVLGGGTNAENNPTSYTIESGAITLTAPTREGYTFAGWYDAEENGNLVTEIAAGSTGNITLYARWTANEFTVTFEANGGTLAEGEGSQSVVYGATATAPAAPTREGYVFVGWYAEGSETAFDFSTAITADIELTAKWELAKYSVSYVLGGGTNAENNPTSYTIESGAITLTAPTREGYTFAGWYDAEENGNLVTEIAAGSTGNITLYARWTANEFTVTFEANGGTLAEGEAVQTVTVGGTVAYVEPVRENYLFVGWFTDEALAERYDFNKVVTGDITLYAKWRLQVVTGTTADGTVVTVSSDTGFDDGTSLRFVEVTDEETINTAAGSLAENMSLARLFDIELIDANGNPIAITQPLSVGISVEGLAEAEGSWGVVYVSDDGSTIETLATHIGTDGRLYFFVEHFSFYAVVDITEIAAGFAWWWILVAVAGCMILALIIVIITRSMRRYELNYVNGGIPSQKLKESALIDLPIPEREEEAFDGWYYDETFRDRATLTSMPKQNLILFAKWRKMTDAERAARDQKRAEEAAQAAEGFHHAEPKKPKNEQHEQPPREIKEDE